ncbi:ER membrane protein complex subunit 7 [Taenia solium]|eukprot:TsM_000527600 transcript=TsM_000527600 gene=TsM_000527600
MNLTFLIVTLILQVLLAKGTDIEGTIAAPIGASPNWAAETKVRVDGNRYLGFVKPDGGFIISDVAPGSYLVEFTNPTFLFQPVRVDINSKGKIRARSVNLLRTTAVKAITHPLRIATVGKAMYFQPREQLRTLDLLLNPTVLCMVIPLLFLMLIPKLMDTNDPEFKEMQKNSIFGGRSAETPDISDYLSSISLFGGSTAKKPPPKKAIAASTTSTHSAVQESRRGGNPRRRN